MDARRTTTLRATEAPGGPGAAPVGPLAGVGVCPGVAVGPVARIGRPAEVPRDLPAPADPAAEVERVQAALDAAADALDEAAEAARERGREEAAEILDAQSMMAADPVLADRAAALVTEGRPGAVAVTVALDAFREQLVAQGGYMAERAADLDGLRHRVVATLLGVPLPGLPEPGHPHVLVADDLTPADTATLDVAQVVGIVTALGGATSHTAIIARSLGIPAVVGCRGAMDLPDETPVLVDGRDGAVLPAPDGDEVARRRAEQEARAARAAAHHGPGRTADGHAVKLLVNLGAGQAPEDAAAVDAEGVGLLRTELLYLDRPDAPTVDEQRAAYRRIFAAFAGRKVVVRTLDAGADKPLPFLTDPDEPNPALGVRGYRTGRRHPELLDEQLRAIADAAEGSGAEVWVMAPMVSLPGEAAAFAAQVRGHGLPVAGTMVEVPAAALDAGRILDACDFVSLGTNDLAQYAFAADRLDHELADLLDVWQPVLLRLVATTATAGRARAKPVGVCGEAAGDPLLAPVLVGLGVTSLSMAAASVPDVRAALAERTLEECRALADAVLAAPDAAAARQIALGG
ncbi:phosphoenolpyruvate--protein phosphotransferase [Patulibacter brassicae]|uniref:Phosphoenolpyruvate-protein phosphotransferase n=1 Tax=Patulibacter brassicae TaxID=1705717 RepID=A0ABU4VLE8_9ACTN|nr:phosphoenolpyruvate--protein phosphotransferase [Patulibacter brassicae]MDX8151698.1 phosphoenolpyruvate--protein phosphotransferase [Patulibacter brassicae]